MNFLVSAFMPRTMEKNCWNFSAKSFREGHHRHPWLASPSTSVSYEKHIDIVQLHKTKRHSTLKSGKFDCFDRIWNLSEQRTKSSRFIHEKISESPLTLSSESGFIVDPMLNFVSSKFGDFKLLEIRFVGRKMIVSTNLKSQRIFLEDFFALVSTGFPVGCRFAVWRVSVFLCTWSWSFEKNRLAQKTFFIKKVVWRKLSSW